MAQTNSPEPNNPRGPMVDDLRKHILHTGMTRDEVQTLLGEPDAGGHEGTDAPPSPKDGSKFSYTLGHWKCPLCDSTLDIAFNANGDVVSITIVTH